MRLIFSLLLILYISLPSFSQLFDNQISKEENSAQYADNPFDELLSELFIEITYGILIESFLERDLPMHNASITPYPYFNDFEGNYTYDKASVPFRVEAAANLNVDTKGKYTGYFSGNFRFLKRMEVVATYLNLRTYENKHNKYLSQTGFLVNYHRIRTRKLDIWYGMGTIFTQDESTLAFTVGGEWFFTRQFSFLSKIKWGIFKDDRMLKNTSFEFNYFMGHWRAQIGLRNIKIPGQQIYTLTTGVKFYF